MIDCLSSTIVLCFGGFNLISFSLSLLFLIFINNVMSH